MDKALVFITKIGPAFTSDAVEIDEAHKALDLAGAPRELSGLMLSLKERIELMRNLWLRDLGIVDESAELFSTLDRGVQ